jgi:3-hydroxyisobutyrate dehydrogenase-like beta-hydroxyacid dehydrogenase
VADVTIVGVGAMGSAVAARLLAKRHAVTLRVRRETDTSRALADAGADVSLDARTPFDAPVVRAVFDRRRIAAMSPGTVHVAMATIGVALSDELESQHRSGGSLYLAAPVLGRPEAARDGALRIVAAGDEAAFAAARAVLADLAHGVRHLSGPASTAHLIKLAVNLNLLHAVWTLGASIGMVERGGVDAATFVEILTDAAYTGTVHRGYGATIASRGYEPAGFTAVNALKDLDLAVVAAASVGLDVGSAELRGVLAAQAADPANSGLDWSALAERYRRPPQ